MTDTENSRGKGIVFCDDANIFLLFVCPIFPLDRRRCRRLVRCCRGRRRRRRRRHLHRRHHHFRGVSSPSFLVILALIKVVFANFLSLTPLGYSV